MKKQQVRRMDLITLEGSVDNGLFAGRGNTKEGHNPFAFQYDIELGDISVIYDGYVPVTANKATVKRGIIEYYHANIAYADQND